MKYVIGNWKCNKTFSQSCSWIDTFSKRFSPEPEVQVVIAPPLLWLAKISDYLTDTGCTHISLAAQDISPFPPGSYTGATAASMLSTVAEYAIIGHAERRRYFHETSQDATNKVSEAVDTGIKPIICVDKPYAMSQLTSLLDLDSEDLIIAYCPVEGRGFKAPEPIEEVEEGVAFVSQVYPERPILYGGAVKPENAADYAQVKGVSGLFVGGSSLQPDTFLEICNVYRG